MANLFGLTGKPVVAVGEISTLRGSIAKSGCTRKQMPGLQNPFKRL